ncbi:MAG: InlB B-repeat-containing protein [Oscillospiraceae bacterium]|nr:InlB B-repeat-containing protein [Oscillospiraceae bacterium]MDY2846852.1 InlB B-repeat-containing protein [Oscillospiraceae bacterium]
MKNIRTAVIAGVIAIAAIAAAIIIIVSGNAKNGLYITAVSGDVSVSNSDNGTSEAVSAEQKLSQGDIITVSEGGSATLTYRTGKNKSTNYLVVLPGSQVFVTDKFKGKEDAELYLNRGTVISSNSEDLGAVVNIRTANSGIGTACAVSTVSYVIGEENNYTEVSSLGGNVYIQLYDDQGDAVNNSEPLGPARKARIISGKNGPYFAYLNENASPSDYDAQQLRELFTISSYVKLVFTSEELKAAYDAIPKEDKSENEPEDLDTVTTPSISEAGTIQTAETITTDELSSDTDETVTTIITSESSETTTTEPTTTTSETTTTTEEETEDTTETEDTDDNDPDDDFDADIYTVYVVIDGVTTEQEVFAGENAVQPADPIIEGKKFIGWDGSFNNITSDTIITALFEDEDTGSSAEEGYHTVTVVIGTSTTTQSVKDGEAANIPATITLEGYTFKGWDKDFSNVTSDMTVTAILEPMTCNVTFIVDGVKYFTTVSYGGTAAAPVTPGSNSRGQSFAGWDKSLSNITSDTTITAIYEAAAKKTYTVTFIVDGVTYTQTVEEGSAATAPSAPATNSEGKTFLGWDQDYSNITSDITIVAVYG